MFVRSANGDVGAARAAACLPTGCDSPVSADSSIFEPGGHEQPSIGRHVVARFEQHDVAGHQIFGRDVELGAARAAREPCMGSIFFSAARLCSARYSW